MEDGRRLGELEMLERELRRDEEEERAEAEAQLDAALAGATDEELSDVFMAISQVATLFPYLQFQKKLPRIVMKHQLYNVVKDRTDVDRELIRLRDEGKVRLFRLGVGHSEYAVLPAPEYAAYLRARALVTKPSFDQPTAGDAGAIGGAAAAAAAGGRVQGSASTRGHVKPSTRRETNPDRNPLTGEGWIALVDKFVDEVLPAVREESVAADVLRGAPFRLLERDISALMQAGMLTGRGVDSFYISIPGAGTFVKSLAKGRSELLSMLKRAKYQEMLRNELLKRKLRMSKIGVPYAVADLTGAQLVDVVPTTSGDLLKWRKAARAS